jgi:hypothetical protein
MNHGRPALLVALILLLATPAAARRVVVLPFSGPKSVEAARALSRQLGGRCELVSVGRLAAEARRRAATIHSAPGRALAARALRVAALLGGTVARAGSRWIVRLVVYSGDSGRLVGAASVSLAGPRIDTAAGRKLVMAISAAMGRARPGPPVATLVAVRSRARVRAAAAKDQRGAAPARPAAAAPVTPPPPTDPAADVAAGDPGQDQPPPSDAGDDTLGFDVDESTAGRGSRHRAETTVRVRARPTTHYWEKAIELSAGMVLLSRSFEFNDPVTPQQPNDYHSGLVPALIVEGSAHPLAFLGRGPLANLGVTASYYRVLVLNSQPPGGGNGVSTTLHQVEAGLRYRWNILGRAMSPTLKVGASFGRLGFSIHWETGTNPSTLPDLAYLYLKLNLVGLEMPFYSSPRFSIGAMINFDYIHVFTAGAIESDDVGGYGRSTTFGIDVGGGLYASLGGFVLRVSGFYRRIGFSFDQQCAQQKTGCNQAGGALDVYRGLTVLGGYAF